MDNRKKRKLFWIAAVAWMGLIFWFSGQNATQSTHLSDSVLDAILRLFWPDFDLTGMTYQILSFLKVLVRKGAHLSVYFVLGMLTYAALRTYDITGVRQRGYALAICLCYAASDEFHQYFVPGRSCQLTDVMIDFCGALGGVILLSLCYFIWEKRRGKRENGA